MNLTTAIKRCVASANIDPSFQVELRAPTEACWAPRYVENELCRIVQEGLNNAQRHARTGRAVVELLFAGGKLVVSVTDEGAGFFPDSHVRSFGIKGMRERAARAGAELEIRSSPGSGTAVRVTMDKFQ
jgi:signal transduction histidine kinase